MWRLGDHGEVPPARTWLAPVLLAALAVLAWGWLRPRILSSVGAPASRSATLEPTGCEPQELTLRAGQGSPRADGVRFATSGFATFPVCGAGLLRMTLHSNLPGAEVLVAQGQDTVWQGVVDDTLPLDVEVPARSWITVAYLNDARVEGRNRDAWVSDLRFVPAP